MLFQQRLISACGQSKTAGTKARFEHSLYFEHKGLRLIGGLVETNGVDPRQNFLRGSSRASWLVIISKISVICD